MTRATKKRDGGVGVRRGDVIGDRYEVVRQLGAGGKGAVIETRHKAIGKTVAIKILRPDVARDPQLAPRFLQEAQAANAVRHKNIVEILDFGVDGDRPYMVIEYLRGESLASLLERERWLPPGKVIRILEPVMRALAFAHDKGVVHRDIKPDNIFLAEEEGEDAPTPKVLDFGIAKRKLPDNPRLTKTQTGLGTPSYMAPEQITAARDVTPAADQYAIGVILYEALCGRRSHEAESYETMIVAKVTQPPVPLETRHPKIDPALAKVVMRALAIAPGERFESVVALRDALAPFRDVLESEEPPDLPARVEGRSEPPLDEGDDEDRGDEDDDEEVSAPTGDEPTVASRTARNRKLATTKQETPETWSTSARTASLRGSGQTEREKPKRGAWLAIAGVVVIGGVATLGWQAGWFAPHASAPAPLRTMTTTASTATTPRAPTEPAPIGSVSIRVRVQPLTAQILLDGSPIGQGVVEMTRPRDGRHYRLVLQAPGYSTVDEELVANVDANIERTLTAIPSAPIESAPTANDAAATRAPAESPRSHRSNGSAGGARHGGGTRGYPTLDRDNPF
jgi:serine/threonine-protein kinase